MLYERCSYYVSTAQFIVGAATGGVVGVLLIIVFVVIVAYLIHLHRKVRYSIYQVLYCEGGGGGGKFFPVKWDLLKLIHDQHPLILYNSCRKVRSNLYDAVAM